MKEIKDISLEPWCWHTSNSWRRLKTARGDNILEPTIQQSDNHPDVICKEENMALIEQAPVLLKTILDIKTVLEIGQTQPAKTLAANAIRTLEQRLKTISR